MQCPLVGKGPERFVREVHEYPEDCCPKPNCDEINENMNMTRLDLINESINLRE